VSPGERCGCVAADKPELTVLACCAVAEPAQSLTKADDQHIGRFPVKNGSHRRFRTCLHLPDTGELGGMARWSAYMATP
jgi:hypothetical protein